MSDPTQPPKKLTPRPIMVEALKQMRELGPDNPRMPESVFIEFLKVFYHAESGKFDTALWYRTFGNLRKGVDITDPAGRVLYTAPPIVGTVDAVFMNRNHSLSSLTDLVALNERRHAALAAQTLNEGLQRYEVGHAHVPRQQWIDILLKYGLLKEDPKFKAQTEGSTSPVPLVGHEEEL